LLDSKQPVKACVEQEVPEPFLNGNATVNGDNKVNSTKRGQP